MADSREATVAGGMADETLDESIVLTSLLIDATPSAWLVPGPFGWSRYEVWNQQLEAWNSIDRQQILYEYSYPASYSYPYWYIVSTLASDLTVRQIAS